VRAGQRILSRQDAEPLTLRARLVLTMHGPPLDGGWVALKRGRIVAVGRHSPPGRPHDLGDAVILPGLVNAHTHLEFSDLAEPLDADGGLPGWIRRVVAERRGRPTDRGDAVRRTILAGLQESANCGVTAIGDIATVVFPDIYSLPGPRTRVYREVIGLSAPAAAASLASAGRDLDRLASAGVPVGVSPHAPYSVARHLGREILARSRRQGLPAAMHLGESEFEADFLANGRGPFRDLFEELGVWPIPAPQLLPAEEWITRLSRSPRGIVVHGTFLGTTAADLSLARLARHRDRLCVVVCPRTTRLLSGSMPPVARYRDAGVRVAIGTDSRASNPDLSVLSECRGLVAAGACSPREALRMATVDAAWAIGFERCSGMLAAGRPADVAILRPESATGDPFATVLDPTTRVAATLRGGRLISGSID